MTCKDCIHYDVCDIPSITSDINHTSDCGRFKNKADFVEVVRCPDCIFCDNMKCTELKDNTGHLLDVAIFDYCSQGVRKERRDT